ncbi:hypothetical protein N0V84_011506 [Fusarium piperis]|uniref:Uncharacterized protein n=1 Tax=Fusarium piperis TaxID=1435070 RepID=A0A9W8TC01_9HYPO|nr:hypothetical protein N0V84_011506 [Fusarium piperis]
MAEGYDQGDPRLISVRFRFKANTLSAIGRYTDAEHPNVLRLTIVRSAFDRTIIRILLALPCTLLPPAESGLWRAWCLWVDVW